MINHAKLFTTTLMKYMLQQYKKNFWNTLKCASSKIKNAKKPFCLYMYVYTNYIPLVFAISLFLSTEAKQTFMYREQDSVILKWCYTFTNSADKSIF